MRDIYRMTLRILLLMACLGLFSTRIQAEQPVVIVAPTLSDTRETDAPGYFRTAPAVLNIPEVDADFFLLLGAVGLGLGFFWLGRRSGAPSVPPNTPRIVRPTAGAGPASHQGREANAENVAETRYWTSLDQATTVTVDELSSVEEEAEVFLLLGRMDMAIGVLRHHIESHDAAPAHIWMSLLDVLHAQGLRQEFEKFAIEIRERFNVAQPSWEGANARSNELTGLEHFPHLLARITTRWRESDCLEYLHSLTQDNRNGERGGFHLEAFRELLMLIGILECRERLAPPHLFA